MTALRHLLATLGLGAVLATSLIVILPAQPARAQLLLGSQNSVAGKGQCVVKGQLDPRNIAPCIDPTNTDFPWILKTWKWSLSVVNVFAVVVLIIMAFANIIYPWKFLEPYRIRQLLPSFIWGIILANASLFLCRATVSLADLLLSDSGIAVRLTDLFQAWGITPGNLNVGVIQAKFGNNSFTNGGALSTNSISNTGKMIYQLLLAAALVYLPIFALLALAFIFYLRFALIFVLTAVSPLAFGAMIFPATQKYLSTWWDTFWKWTFGGVASYLLFYLAMQVADSGIKGGSLSNATYVDIIPYGISLFLIYLAIQAPFKLGGAAASWYLRAGKWAVKSTRNVGAGLAKDWEQTRKDSHLSRLYGNIGIGANRRYGNSQQWFKDEQARVARGERPSSMLRKAWAYGGLGFHGAIAKTNRYGALGAKDTRRKFDDNERVRAAWKSSTAFQKGLGRSGAALKFFEEYNRPIINDLPLSEIDGRLQTDFQGARGRFNSLTPKEQKDLLRGGFADGERLGARLGLDSNQTAQFKILMQRKALLEEQYARSRVGQQGAAGGGPHGVPAAASISAAGGSGYATAAPAAPAASGPHAVPAATAPPVTAPAGHPEQPPTVAGGAAGVPLVAGVTAGASTAAVTQEIKSEGSRTEFADGTQPQAGGAGASHTIAAAPVAAGASTAATARTMRLPPTLVGEHHYASAPTPVEASGIGRASAIGTATAPLGAQQLTGRAVANRVEGTHIQSQKIITQATRTAGATGEPSVGAALPGKGPIVTASTEKTATQLVQEKHSQGTAQPVNISAPGRVAQPQTTVRRSDQEIQADIRSYDAKIATPSQSGQRTAAEVQSDIQAYDAKYGTRPVTTVTAQPAAPVAMPVRQQTIVATAPAPAPTITYTTSSSAAVPAGGSATVAHAEQQKAAQQAQIAQQRQAEQTLINQTRASAAKTSVGRAAQAIRGAVAQGQAVKQAATTRVVNAGQAVAAGGRVVKAQTLGRATSAIKGVVNQVAQSSVVQRVAAEAGAAKAIVSNARTAKVTKQQAATDQQMVQAHLMDAAKAGGSGTLHERAAGQLRANVQHLSQRHENVSTRLADVTQRVNQQLVLAGYAGVQPGQKGFEKADPDLRQEMMDLRREQKQVQEDLAANQRRLGIIQNQQ